MYILMIEKQNKEIWYNGREISEQKDQCDSLQESKKRNKKVDDVKIKLASYAG